MSKEKQIINNLSNIDGSFASYNQLIELYQKNKDIELSTITISLHNWFAANMSAALGAILDKFQETFNTIDLKLDKKIELILLKNEFLSFYNFPMRYDKYHTTIRYQKLKPKDSKFFNDYVFNELLWRDELPDMSSGIRNKIAEAIYEIFINAQIHSETEYIYTCGQFYPTKDKIEFTVVDIGIGFKNRVNKRFNTKLSAIQAIKWAVKDKSTTKVGISGGIGLAFLKEFIGKNRGKMQIISNDGFYQYSEGREVIKLLNGEFPGTIVNLQFKTDDKNSYILQEEIDISDIF